MRCEEVRQLTPRFVACESSTEFDIACREEMRYHLSGCSECRAHAISEYWKRFFRRPGLLALMRTVYSIRRLRPADVDDCCEDGPIMRVVNLLLQKAIDAGASEVHVERIAGQVRVSHRVGGEWHVMEEMPEYVDQAIRFRLKVMANLRLLREDIPQEGRIPIYWRYTGYDLRLSTLPSESGENLHIRIEAHGSAAA